MSFQTDQYNLVESELHRARSKGARSQEAGVVFLSGVRVEVVQERCW